MAQFRTDLAMESYYAASGGRSMEGVQVSQWEEMGVMVTEVVITTEAAGRKLGKPVGTYLTLECPAIRQRDPDARQAVSLQLAQAIVRLLPSHESDAPILVIGLGNRAVTPDALGPMTVDRTLVTRHIFRELPEAVDERMHSVCAFAPGVLGVTGLETFEVVKSAVEAVRPRCVIAIDSLAARQSNRVGATVQIADTGIQPGSGVGNHRRAITEATLGVKVIGIGIPTVVYAATIVRDAFQQLSEGEASDESLDILANRLLEEELGAMIVTPREVDALIADAAKMMAQGLNRALHPGITDEEMAVMMD